MKALDIKLNNQSGLHARPAKNFMIMAKQFAADISVYYMGKKANGKSMISLLTLGAESGAQIRIEVQGEDEEDAFMALKESIEQGFLED
jgi:phosphotransferase system HPr (HPr) family protein